jgi:sulfoxide reductase heme-binding subunit YedZ
MLIWLMVLLPLMQLGWAFYQLQFAGNILYLGAEPGKAIVHTLGQWAVVYLMWVLVVPVIRRYTKVNLIAYRRRLGLAAFTYGLFHVLGYLVFLLGLEWSAFYDDLYKRPYMLAGMVAMLLMVPLAITSTKGWQKKLKHNWKRLHQLVYPSALLVVIHLWWQVKAGFMLAAVVTLIFVSILLLKIFPDFLARFKSSSNL